MALSKIKSDSIVDPLDISSKTVTLPAASVTAHASPAPTLDAPVITGTLSVLDSGAVTHTIANWSDDVSYTITPTNCTAGAVNASGQFVITHTSGTPSYTIKATTASLGLGDSALTTKNITMTLTAPTLSSPADVGTVTDVTYTITSTTAFDDKLILDPGTANFTYQSVSGGGTASKVGNTVECVGFTTNNPVVIIRFTAEATYSVTAKAVKIDGTYGTSANSSADSIVIQNYVGMVATGGAETTNGDYKVRRFTASGTFEVTTLGHDAVVEYLIVAGGGAGASGHYSGGGGAGGLLTATGLSVSETTYSVQIGAGGDTNGQSVNANPGVDSYFGDGGSRITCTGGGFGNGYSTSSNGGAGGSGGGASGSTARQGGTGVAGPPRQGYDGGDVGGYGNGSGGGGAGEVGQAAPFPPTTSNSGGDGGDGLQSDIMETGVNLYYAGGGAGGSGYTSTVGGGNGGQGGGGDGGSSVTANEDSTPGTDYLGGGGGGSTGPNYDDDTGKSGGDGVVIIRYKFQ